MLVSELIAELEKLRTTYGDKPVVAQYPSGKENQKISTKFSSEILPVLVRFGVVLQVYEWQIPIQGPLYMCEDCPVAKVSPILPQEK